MGGILFDISQETITPQHSALEVIRHRGSGWCDVKTFPEFYFNINLGCRHNQITDLTETGRQPISYEDGDCWIVMDGEIFNYRDIRRQLSSEGYAFKSSSDAEVVLAAYCRWGVRCLKYFRGMFSFCIYHRMRRTFFLARDPVGIKPLYFVNQNDCFRVGSEIKQFFSVPNFVPQINNRMLCYYLSSGHCHRGAQTLWQGVYELSPGHYIEGCLNNWAPGQALQSFCWSKYKFEIDENMEFYSSADEYRRIFNETLREQLHHDYPSGYRLTGDICTAVNTLLACNVNREHMVKTYSLVNEHNYPDRIHLVRQLRKSLKLEEHLTEFHNKDFFLEFDKMIYANDFPLEFGRGIFNWMLYVVDGACRDRIIIDGEGAAQFLFSDLDFYWAYLNRTMYNSSAAGFISDIRHLRMPGHNPWIKMFEKLRNMTLGRNSSDSTNVINRGVLLGDWRDEEMDYSGTKSSSSLLDFARDDILHLTENLLFLDRCAAMGGCELRHPFLDPRLIEFSLKLPLHFKVAGGMTKVILRESFRDLLPASLIDTPDYSDEEFTTRAKWQKRLFHTLLLANVDDILREPYVVQSELVKTMQRFTLRQRPFSPVIWRLIAVNRWKKVFNLS